MKLFRSILSGISVHNKIIIVFALVAGLFFMLLNMGSNFVIDLIISESLDNQVNYKLEQVTKNFDNEFLHISNTLDNFVIDETVEAYILRDRNGGDARNEEQLDYISGLFRILETSVDSFEFLSVMDDEGTVLRYGNAYDKQIDVFESEIQRDIYNRQDLGKLIIKYGMRFSKDKYGVEKRITFISKKYRINNRVVVLNLGLDEEMFLQALIQKDADDCDGVLIVDENMEYIFRSNEGLLEDISAEALCSQLETSFRAEDSGDEIYISGKKSYMTGDSYFYALNKTKTVEKYTVFKSYNIVFAIIVLLICIAVVRYTVKKLIRYLMRFSDSIDELESEITASDVDSNLHIDSLERVKDVYAQMLGKIQRMMQYIRNRERELGVIEKQNLQHQINPHFLYNSIMVIQMMSEINGDEEVSEMTTILGRILRYGLSIENEGMVRLRDELENVDEYISFMNYRLNYEIAVHKEYEEALLDAAIPRMTMQPIVENCFVHGNIGSVPGGEIRLEAFEKDGLLCIRITDNGEGVENIAKNKTGIGLKNVEKRLQLCFGKHAALKLESTLGTGTQVMIDIPMKKEEDL